MLVGGGDDTRERFRAGVVHRSKSNLINQDEVSAQDLDDHHADRIVARKLTDVLWYICQTGAALVPGGPKTIPAARRSHVETDHLTLPTDSVLARRGNR